jgi:molybdopterin synthase sulfur carrier subunit
VTVRVLFFASLRESAGTEGFDVELEAPVSLDGLMLLISQRLDEKGMAALGAENVRVAINQALVAAPQTISPGDEVAFMPPVTGG